MKDREILSVDVATCTRVTYPDDGVPVHALRFEAALDFLAGSVYYVLLDPGTYISITNYNCILYATHCLCEAY